MEEEEETGGEEDEEESRPGQPNMGNQNRWNRVTRELGTKIQILFCKFKLNLVFFNNDSYCDQPLDFYTLISNPF